MLTIGFLCTLAMYLLGGVAKPETPQDAATHPFEATPPVGAIGAANIPSLQKRTRRAARG